MAFQSSSDNHQPLSEINITPFVDVMLVLLIIFMVAAPMLESGIRVELPRASNKALPKPQDPVTLHLTKKREIFLNKEQVRPNRLTKTLIAFYKNRKKREIFIRADGSLPYRVVAKTMAEVKSAGISKIGLVTLPKETRRKKKG